MTIFTDLDETDEFMRKTVKDSLSARNSFVTKEKEATRWKESVDDPWVVDDIKL